MAAQNNEMAAGVTQIIADEWNDGLAKATPLWDTVVKGDGREKFDGGLYLQVPIKLIANATQGFIGLSGGTVGITDSVQEQYMILNHKCFYLSTNMTLYDETVANGEQDKIKILAKKIKGALNDANRSMATATYTGTFSAAGGTQSTYPLSWDGLEDVVVASGTSYAGLTDTNYTDATAFLPYISTATVPTYTTVSDMIAVVRGRITQSEYNPERMFGLMNPATFSKFQVSVQNAQVFMEREDMYSAGGKGFRVNDVEFYLDAYCPGDGTSSSTNNYIYIIPTEIFKFFYKFGFDSKSPFDTKDMRIPDQPILSTQQFIVGNWVCTDRRLIAVTKTIAL